MEFEQTPAPTAPAEPWRPASLGRAAAARLLGRLACAETMALGSLLVLALYLDAWRLSRNGFANEYYSAAVLSATKSWSAFFFGSLDASNFITIDKPPLALWPQALAARLFGFGSWSLLLPQALIAVGSVAVLYRVVRMTAGRAAALIAAAALVVSPVSVAVSRDNIPDSLLTFLLLLSAWGLVSSLRSGRLVPLILAGVAIGLAFNVKLLQAYLVIPPFTAVYLLCADSPLRVRFARLAMAGSAVVAVSAIWVGAMTVIPAGDRPYVGGSVDNSASNLLFGYDGLGRITGWDDTPGPGLGNAGPHFGGDASLGRMFNDQLAGEISWLIPLAVAGLVAGLAAARHLPSAEQPRETQRRSDTAGARNYTAGVLLWGGWAAVHGAVFSLQAGIFHPYYTAALAPGLAALVGIGGVAAWQLSRRSLLCAISTVSVIGVTVLWDRHVLGWTPDWHPWLSAFLIVAAFVAAAGWLLLPFHGRLRRDPPPIAESVAPLRSWRRPGRLALGAGAVTVAASLAAVLSAPAAYAFEPMKSAVQGVNPTAGPARAFAFRPGAARGPGGTVTGPLSRSGSGVAPAPGSVAGTNQNGRARPTGPLAPPQGGSGAGGPRQGGGPQGQAGPGARPPGTGAFGPPAAHANAAIVAYLLAHDDGQRWIAATTDATSASRLILATGRPVMGMGGFNSTDPAPTIPQLESYVASGELRYVILGGTGGFGLNGRGERTDWVAGHCAAVRAGGGAGGFRGGEQLYDCRGAAGP